MKKDMGKLGGILLVFVALFWVCLAHAAATDPWSSSQKQRKNSGGASGGTGGFPGSGMVPGFGNMGGFPGIGTGIPGVTGDGWSIPGTPPAGMGFPTSFLCTDKGPCYNKKLSCPKRCFKYSGRYGPGGGGGGGGGGCAFDCKRCVAYC